MNATKNTCTKKRKSEELDNSNRIPGEIIKRKRQNSKVTTSTFDILDVYCLAHIFSFLDWKDGFSMRQVSKKCKSAMEHTWSTVRVFESNNEPINLHGKNADDARERYFLLYCAKYLRKHEKQINFPITHKCFEVLRRDCRNLTFLDISVIFQHKHYLFDAFTNMQQLKTIKIRLLPPKKGVCIDEDLYDTRILDSVTKNVQELTLDGYDALIRLGKQFARIFEKFKSLTSLEFFRWTFESSVLRVISQKITLRKLAFVACILETIDDLMLSNFINLKSLSFTHAYLTPRQDNSYLCKYIAIHQKNLVSLDVRGLYVNYETFLLFTKFTNLKELDLCSAFNFKNSVLSLGLSQIKNLIKFSCMGRKTITDSFVKDFMERNKNLEYLNIAGTSITLETVRFLYDLTKTRKHNAAVVFTLAVDSKLFEEAQDFLKLSGDNPHFIVEFFSYELMKQLAIAIIPKFTSRLRPRSNSVGAGSNNCLKVASSILA